MDQLTDKRLGRLLRVSTRWRFEIGIGILICNGLRVPVEELGELTEEEFVLLLKYFDEETELPKSLRKYLSE